MDQATNTPEKVEKLRQLMEAYETPIRRMCYVYLQDIHLAADAVQETFLRAYQAWEKFRGQSSEKTWLMRIAVNVCHNMRRTGWMRFVDRRVTMEKLPEQAGNADYGLVEMTVDIMNLPRKMKDVVLLHDYQQFTLRETARMLGVTHQTVINRLRKAHQLLRISLEGGEENEP